MPVYQDAVVFLGVAITLAFLLIIGAVGALFSRRTLHRRLAALAALVSEDGAGGRRLADTLDRLEHVTESRTIRVEVPSGQPVRAAATVMDTAGDRLRLTLGELPVGIVICDETRKVVYRNPAAAKQVWPRRADASGNGNGNGRAAGRTEPELADGLSAVLDEALAGRRISRPVEVDGPPPRTLRLTAVPLEDGTRLVGAMVVVEDLADDQRETTARRDVLADLGRELVEPMVAMSVLADGLASEEDPTIRRRLADRARAESTRARRMVDDLIELGRMASRVPSEREEVRLAPVVMQATAAVEALAQQRLVEVRLHDMPADAAVLGDRRQVELAMSKLLEHAVDTARAGAKLEVHVDVKAVEGGTHASASSWLDIEVLDACPSTAATRAPGLTFAIVEQAARNLGGSATFHSTPDLTTSVLRLPATDPLTARREHADDHLDSDHTDSGVTATAA